jgi:hypothetical protein
MVRELLLTLGGDGAVVDLVATTIVVVLSGDLRAARITASAGGVPLEDVDDLFSVGRLGGSVDKDSTAHLGFARLVLRQSDVAVLEVLHGDVRARRSLETGVGGIVVVGSALAGVAEKISTIDASAARCKGWQQVDDSFIAIEAGISASNIATSEAVVASVVAGSRVDDLHLLDPSMSGCLAENGSNNSSSKCELHFVRCWFFEVVLRDVLLENRRVGSEKERDVTKDPRTCEEISL